MRTTLPSDDDVLAAARAMAAQQKRTLGDVISELVRHALRRQDVPRERDSVPLLPVTNAAAQVTLEIVNGLRDEAP